MSNTLSLVVLFGLFMTPDVTAWCSNRSNFYLFKTIWTKTTTKKDLPRTTREYSKQNLTEAIGFGETKN